jgi:NAD(P)-dependent dehydrogenase (short-subunit alcohol dehydrogenase family)
MNRLQGKTAIVTGGGQGIGRGIAMAFASEGAAVWVSDYFPERAKSVAEEIKKAGGTAFGDHVDVTQEESVKGMFERFLAKFEQLDVLVNNAGIEVLKSIEETAAEDFDRVFAVNVRGVFLCCKHAIPQFKKQGKGNIVNMGSSAGYIGAPFQTVYCASKGAVHQLTKALAVECTSANIRVNAIAPGGVKTAMLDYLSEEFMKRGVDINAFSSMHMGGWSTPEDIAQMAVYLASDESRSVHGAALLIDGGLTAA